MKALIIGASESDGSNLPDPSQGLPAILARELPALAGQPVELAYARFDTCVPGAGQYVDRQIQNHQPDVTIVAATAAGFAYPMVGAR